MPVHSMRLRGVVAKQEVVFGGEGETLTLTHDTISQRAYEQGAARRLAEPSPASTGVVVGLDSVLPLD